jgi:WhiB family redox-sensing transcriptional regulator
MYTEHHWTNTKRNSAEVGDQRPDAQGGSARMEWRKQAACRHEDPELFFPIGSGESAIRQTAAAKTVCGRCEVVSSCLSWALENGPMSGIWGGTTEEERAMSRRRLHLVGVPAGQLPTSAS